MVRSEVSRGAVVAMTTEALRTVKDRFSEYVDRVEREHERVVVTRNGRPTIVPISTEDLASLEETLAVLSDPEALDGLRAGASSPWPVTERFPLVVASPAARALADELLEAVAVAIIGFITGALLDDPRRVGRELRRELAGVRAVRRGTYRVLYRIDEDRHEVTVVRIDHRKDVYRA
ncbi:MAG: type II toxin-antitoxin system prevent-host-death family antitoxin [Ilumatobacteraceae bacterium]